jgi:pyruvate/2-oxoglutarate/acetoin dehydrogenase E1 component
MKRLISFAEALREAQEYCLSTYRETILLGLGVPDPKGIFGSTIGLQEKFGKDRVFDIPLAENAMTGVAIGSAITGLRPILTHQRVDFALVSMEQIINQAAKWHYMFSGQMQVPMVIRMIIGRGWGQGAQHSQSLQVLFSHIPGLKVIMPSTPYDAKGMLISAIEDNNPVICLEHRWLYNIEDHVPENDFRISLKQSKVMRNGKDITLIGISYMVLECLKAAELLENEGIFAEVIDTRCLRPLDYSTMVESVKKTKKVIIADHGHVFAGMSAEIAASLTEQLFPELQCTPVRMGFPDHPTPTSPALADNYYPQSYQIANRCLEILKKPKRFEKPELDRRLDQPDVSFQGPF